VLGRAPRWNEPGLGSRHVALVPAVCVLGAMLVAGWGPGVGALASGAIRGATATGPSQVRAERLLYNELDAALSFVGPLRVAPDQSLSWLSVSGDDSGKIVCVASGARAFACRWRAKLLQTYAGSARVAFGVGSPSVVFGTTRCVNPKRRGIVYPDLCKLDPVPGMVDD
jgi:hypothetical protein